ncbi:XRE family transcriptional regulator [Actinokineospora sp. PR83]|uniref:helix-turn-helix domain-containing protein n=1 Tax=Actinokineospora sp. PR83 TaxID=2884908 RepID=UPI0027DF6323|nr:XRE family transcriptional regulator [Actinokineospora sp. PR83]MCG8916795.1 XRE family transcriptional regulator [Actinokineospora sp. PR83]
MFTPERLVLARKRRRMTLAALSRASGVSPQSITAFENGRKTPSLDTLNKLSEALNYPISFLGDVAIREMQLEAVSFRAPSKISALERDSTLSSGTISTTFNDWMESKFRLPPVSVPTYPHLPPEGAAEQVRASWGLGEAPAPNMVHLLESKGVRVFSLPSDCLDVDAFSTIHNGTYYVFLNTRKTGERGRFDAAHELGHLILHCEHRAPMGRESEAEANEFASAFLMPRAGLIAQRLHNASVDRIISAKRRWGVSAMALTYRARSLELLSEWRYNQIVKELSRMGYRRSEPGSTMVRESSKLLAKVFDTLRDQGISPSDIAGQLKIPAEELSEYVFGLIPIVMDGGGIKTSADRPNLRLVSK